MNLSAFPLPSGWTMVAHALVVLIGLSVLRRAAWSRLRDNAQSHLFLGSCLTLVFVWGLRPPALGGIEFHLLGSTLISLMFGPHLALLAVGIATVGLVVVGRIAPEAYSVNVLLLGGIPVGLSWLVLRFTERMLPANFFVYIFGPGFFGAALGMVASGAVVAGLAAGFGEPATRLMAGEFLPYCFLLAFAEATLTGMLITLMVVYRPHWVGTFDDVRYLSGR